VGLLFLTQTKLFNKNNELASFHVSLFCGVERVLLSFVFGVFGSVQNQIQILHVTFHSFHQMLQAALLDGKKLLDFVQARLVDCILCSRAVVLLETEVREELLESTFVLCRGIDFILNDLKSSGEFQFFWLGVRDSFTSNLKSGNYLQIIKKKWKVLVEYFRERQNC